MAQEFRLQSRFTDIAQWVRDSARDVNAFFRIFSNTQDGITAGTTQTQAGATGLEQGINRVSTATTNDGVRLPFGSAGDLCIVRNEGGAAIKIWPPSGYKIDSGTTNAADANTLADGSAREYRAISSTEWITTGNS